MKCIISFYTTEVVKVASFEYQFSAMKKVDGFNYYYNNLDSLLQQIQTPCEVFVLQDNSNLFTALSLNNTLHTINPETLLSGTIFG